MNKQHTIPETIQLQNKKEVEIMVDQSGGETSFRLEAEQANDKFPE